MYRIKKPVLVTVALGVRLPESVIERLDAIAESESGGLSKCSRNAVVAAALEIGLAEIERKLKPAPESAQ